jgi:hypothetical protein
MNPSLGRNFEAMDPIEWLARISDHIPDPGQHRTIFYGEYSSRVRGSSPPPPEPDATLATADSPPRRRCSPSWARMIAKVFSEAAAPVKPLYIGSSFQWLCSFSAVWGDPILPPSLPVRLPRGLSLFSSRSHWRVVLAGAVSACDESAAPSTRRSSVAAKTLGALAEPLIQTP